MADRNGSVIEPVALPAEEPETGRSRWGVRFAALAGLASFALWAYAFSPFSRTDPPDYLQDRSWPAAAEPICAAALVDLNSLPFASTSGSPLDRAKAVEAGTERLQTMVDELARLPLAETGTDRTLVTLWLADWETYLADRTAFSTGLRTDPATKFVLTMRGAHAITRPLDQVAKNNRMPSCASPSDA